MARIFEMAYFKQVKSSFVSLAMQSIKTYLYLTNLIFNDVAITFYLLKSIIL